MIYRVLTSILFLFLFNSSFALDPLQNQTDQDKINNTRAKLKEVGKALYIYKMDCETFPTRISQLFKDKNCSNWGPLAYVTDIKDSWGHDLQYKQLKDGKSFVLKSLGADQSTGGKGSDRDISYNLKSFYK